MKGALWIGQGQLMLYVRQFDLGCTRTRHSELRVTLISRRTVLVRSYPEWTRSPMRLPFPIVRGLVVSFVCEASLAIMWRPKHDAVAREDAADGGRNIAYARS
nr:hypothetical protein CFP56_34752 [Quercus suber]